MSDDSGDESDELGSNPLGGMLYDEDEGGDVSNSFEEPDGSRVEQIEVDEEKNAEDVRRDALKLFTSTDFVMEPEVLPTLSRYFKVGGDPETVVQSLAEHYQSLAQICNIMGEWLLQLEDRPDAVQDIFEQSLSSLISRHFEPKQADRIFDQQNAEGAGIDWLPELIAHAPWRSLVYSLAEEYPDCLMLNFAVKLISDAGFQHEISNVTTAAQQLEIFSRVLSTAVDGVLAQHRKGPATDSYDRALTELVRVAGHSEHTYMYSQALLHLLAHQEQHESSAAFTHLSQSLRLAVRDKGQDSTWLDLALLRACAEDGALKPPVVQAMCSMMNKMSLNPADMTVLYQHFTQNKPPPVAVIRDPLFVELVMDALFRPKGVKIHADHRPKYLYLLAYASSVAETVRNGQRMQSREELDTTKDALDRMSQLCQERSGGEGSHEILMELPQIFHALKFPSVAAGMLHWIRCTVTEADYFKLHPESVPIHLALLDEIATNHPLLHPKVFKLLTELFDRETAGDGAVGELLMERQKTFIDRLVHMLSVGFALPVTEFMARIFRDGQADISLIRYFATETLEIVCPPFSQDFVDVFLPLVENKEIFDENVHEKMPAAKEFLEQCSSAA